LLLLLLLLLTEAEVATEAVAFAVEADEELLELVIILGLLSMLAIIEPSRSPCVVLAAALLPARMILCEGKLNVL